MFDGTASLLAAGTTRTSLKSPQLWVRWIVGTLLWTIALFFLHPQASAVVVEQPLIESIVQEHVEAMAAEKGLLKDGGNVSIKILQIPKTRFEFPEVAQLQDLQFEAESSLNQFFTGNALVQVRARPAKGLPQQVGVPIRISIQRPVWVVKNKVPQGQPILSSDFALTTRTITQQFEQLVPASFPIGNYAARITLQPDWTLNRNHLQRIPDVHRLGTVKLKLIGENGTLVVMDGQCLEDGHIGQLVRVRHQNLRDRYYTAKVTGENQVQAKL